jgi:hypothetical protein
MSRNSRGRRRREEGVVWREDDILGRGFDEVTEIEYKTRELATFQTQ